MNERERWIVYPLLFLALGASLKSKLGLHDESELVLIKNLHAERMTCDNAAIDNLNVPHKLAAHFIEAPKAVFVECESGVQKSDLLAGRVLLIENKNGLPLAKLAVNPKNASGIFSLFNELGLPIVILGSQNGDAGSIELWKSNTPTTAQLRLGISADSPDGKWEVPQTEESIKPQKPSDKDKTDKKESQTEEKKKK